MGVPTQPPPPSGAPKPHRKYVKSLPCRRYQRKKEIWFDVPSRRFVVCTYHMFNSDWVERDLTEAEKAEHLTPRVIADCISLAMGR